jgi:hypothetical protein
LKGACLRLLLIENLSRRLISKFSLLSLLLFLVGSE